MTALQRRVKATRARAGVRRWEFRQRNLAHGAWFRFRWALTFASVAYAITEDEARTLLAAGAIPDPGGRDLEPPRTLIWITGEVAERLGPARRLEMHLDATLLAARWLALVPFPDCDIAPASP